MTNDQKPLCLINRGIDPLTRWLRPLAWIGRGEGSQQDELAQRVVNNMAVRSVVVGYSRLKSVVVG